MGWNPALVRASPRIEQHRHANHALPSDQSQLDLSGVLGRGDDRDDALFDEPDAGDGGIGRDQDLADGEGTDVEVGTSVGVAIHDDESYATAEQLLREADTAMYRDKQKRGR